MRTVKRSVKALSIMLCLVTFLAFSSALFPLIASAATVGEFTVEGGTENTDYTYADGVLTILTNTSLTVSGTTTTGRIVIAENATANLTIHNLSVDIQNGNAIDISSGSTLNLTLSGSNTLRPGGTKAGIHVPDGTILKVSGEGSLEVYGGRSGSNGGAAIGANQGGTLGTIEIQSGTITAKAASGGGAGIGMGGWGGTSTNASVTISGGYVTSTGAGSEGSFYGGTIEITGGVVMTPDTKLSSTEMSNCLVFQGNAGQVYGTVTLPDDFTVENNKSLTVPEGATLNTSAYTLTNNGIVHVVGTIDGTLTNNGTINVSGTINGTLNNSGEIYRIGDATVPDGTASTILTSGWPCGDLLVAGGKFGTDFSYANGVLTILTSTQLTISGTTTADRIVVGDGVTANVILNGVSIAPAQCPFTIPSGASATITLAARTTNTLTGNHATSSPYGNYAGLNVPSGAAVTINCGNHQGGGCDGGSDCGKLVATGDSSVQSGWIYAVGGAGAGIGGNGSYNASGQSAGTITINGGVISAIGGTFMENYGGRGKLRSAAGIGGGGANEDGISGSGGTVTINGGIVSATGGGDINGIGGDINGIGGGYVNGSGGSLTITGGILKNTSFATTSTNGNFTITGGTLTGCTLGGTTASLNGGTVSNSTVQSNQVTANNSTITNSTVKNITGWTDSANTTSGSTLSFSYVPELTKGGNNNTYTTEVKINGAAFTGTTNFNSDVTIESGSFDGTTTIDGNVTNNGEVSFAGTATVAGSVTNTGSMVCKENASVVVNALTNNSSITIEKNATLLVETSLVNNGTISGEGAVWYDTLSGTGSISVTGMPQISVSYLNENGEKKETLAYILTADLLSSNNNSLTNGCYFVADSLTIGASAANQPRGITVLGDVTLILGDNTTLTVNGGISVNKGYSLTICAQSTGDEMGKLIAQNEADDNAVIGGDKKTDAGTITINGGDITATGGWYAAAIGGGRGASGGDITINGGIVTAKTRRAGAAIGTGDESTNGCNITINGGTVTATGAASGAGIGAFARTKSGTSGTIKITGGTVTATGGNNGAGIGYSYHTCGSGQIIISGGTITAKGGEGAAGIGADRDSYSRAPLTIDISGGTIYAEGKGTGAGIGGTRHSYAGDSITISGGTITAVGGASSKNDIGDGSGGSAFTFSTTDAKGNIGNAVIIAEKIDDTTNQSTWNGIINYTMYGNTVTPTEDFEIPAGTTLTIASGQTLTVAEDITLTNNGTINLEEGGQLIVDGTLINNGAIIYNGTLTENGTLGGTGFNIYVKTLTGEHILFNVSSTDAISALKSKIFNAKAIPVDKQMLKYAGTTLEDDKTFGDYNIQKDSTIHLIVTHTVTFDANGGNGTMDSVTVTENENYTLPECTFTAPDGYVFKAWSVGGTEYAVGDSFTVTEDTTVTAVWEAEVISVTITWGAMEFTYTEEWNPDSHEYGNGEWTANNASNSITVENNGNVTVTAGFEFVAGTITGITATFTEGNTAITETVLAPQASKTVYLTLSGTPSSKEFNNEVIGTVKVTITKAAQ